MQQLLLARVAEAQAETEAVVQHKAEISAENARLHEVVTSLRARVVGGPLSPFLCAVLLSEDEWLVLGGLGMTLLCRSFVEH